MGRAFQEALRELNRGSTLNELDAQFAALVQAVQQHKRKGTITLTIDVRPVAGADSHQLLLKDSISLSLPEPDRAVTLLFADSEGSLSRRDPRQPEIIGLREVTPMPVKARDLDEGVGGA